MRKAAMLFPVMAVLALLSSAIQVRAEDLGVSFDQGVDVKAVLAAVKEKAAETKAVAAHAPVASYFTRYDRDCASFTFGAKDNPQSSEVWLRSTEWIEECHPVPNPPYPPYPYPPHPGYGPYPRPMDGTYHVRDGQNCYERPGRTYQERASVAIRDRQELFPWEFDSFQVCLEGPWLNFYQQETAFEYKVVQGGNYDGRYVVSPIRKIKMNPDPAGIVAQSFTPAMTLTLFDRWASYYRGEQTVLVLKLRKDVPNWFDATLVEKTLTFPAAENYTVNFLAFASEFSQKPENGKKYYVEYHFKRVGNISKDKQIKVGETDRAAYQAPATLGYWGQALSFEFSAAR